MIFEEKTIETAYLYLKNYTYHDNLNLFLRQRVAEFEIKNDADGFDNLIKELAEILNQENVVEHPIFNKWISEISYHVLPKSISQAGSANKKEEQGLFLTNVRSAEKYTTEKINYFINAPIQLYIIEILWTLIVGSLLDKQLTKDCYGNRLSDYALNFHQKKSRGEVFKRYVEQYNKWRDEAIKTAIEEAEKGENVALFSLDFQSFFYNIDIKFDDVRKEISNNKRAELLTNLLEKIVIRYNETISSELEISHPECEKKTGLPISLASSSVLANWYLREFDKKVAYEIRPIYYGRYVDDILMVFKQPDLHDKSNEKTPFADFIGTYLCLLEKEDKGESYFIKVDVNKISVQKDKLILHYFDKEHSLAGLEVFKQELEERSSAFKFLPDDKHINSDLNKFAYDVLYDGSANKLRSIIGLSENETELSRYLSSHITAHRLCKVDKKHQVLPQLKLFLRGTNVLKFHRLWEKVYQYMTVVQDEKSILDFYKYLNEEIDKLSFEKSSEINTTLKSDLKRFNDLAFALSIALKGTEHYKDTSDSSLKETFAYQFRESNLIRHHLVAWSLANFTSYDGDLTDETTFRRDNSKSELDENKLNRSPRFIHFDEWQLLNLHKHLHNGEGNFSAFQEESLNEYKKYSRWDDKTFPVSFKPETGKPNLSTLKIGKKQITKICVGIANFELNEKDIENAIRKDKSPNLSLDRQIELYRMLNDAERNNVDLLVMPELAIPVSWLPFMVARARRNEIGLVFGLEHWVVDNVAYNLIIEALPFKNGKYKSCVMTARIKNHYAPSEQEMLESLRIAKPEKPNGKYSYHKVQWNGLAFATYNCFELADITHRALFKSELDLLIACVWNKDIHYYEHILEATVRDLHCYVVQSNTSQYGGSCVLQPSKTETKTMLYVKGGKNACILTIDLDIQALRDFQFKSKGKDRFKTLPPGYVCEEVLKRSG